MDQEDDGQQYDHTEQRRYEEEHGLTLPLLGGKLERMARVLNTHRRLTRLDSELRALRIEREQAQREFDALCKESPLCDVCGKNPVDFRATVFGIETAYCESCSEGS